MNCKKCGQENQSESNYCRNCGNQLKLVENQENINLVEKSKKIKRSVYFVHIIIAIVLIMMARYYEVNNNSGYFSEGLEGLFYIVSFMYLVVVGYKFIFYKK